MSFSFDVKGMVELKARLAAMKERAANPGPGLLRAGLVVVRSAKDVIKSGGGSRGPWVRNQSGTPLLFRTGRMINSLTVAVQGNEAIVGTNVSYAKFVQFGTGIYGPTGRRIFPLHARALAWDGHVVKSIAGSPARPWLYIDEAQAERIRAVFAAYIMNGVPTNDAGGV